MFAAWCDQEQTEVLLSERRITTITSTATHVEVHFLCWCGAEGHYIDMRLGSSPGEPARPTPTLASA